MNYKYNFTLYRFSILNLMGHMVADFFIQQMTLFVLNIKRLLIKKHAANVHVDLYCT